MRPSAWRCACTLGAITAKRVKPARNKLRTDTPASIRAMRSALWPAASVNCTWCKASSGDQPPRVSVIDSICTGKPSICEACCCINGRNSPIRGKIHTCSSTVAVASKTNAAPASMPAQRSSRTALLLCTTRRKRSCKKSFISCMEKGNDSIRHQHQHQRQPAP